MEETRTDPRCVQQHRTGYLLRQRIDNEYSQSTQEGTFREELTEEWDKLKVEWASETEAVLLEIGGPIAKSRFKNAPTSLGTLSGNWKWNNIRNFLQGRLTALETICKTL
jgi:hypothetical protein